MMAHVGVYKCRKCLGPVNTINWGKKGSAKPVFLSRQFAKDAINIHYSSASGKGLMLISAFASPLQ